MATPAREEGGCLLDASSAEQDEVDSRRVRLSVSEGASRMALLSCSRASLTKDMLQGVAAVAVAADIFTGSG